MSFVLSANFSGNSYMCYMLYVSCSGLITSVKEERDTFVLLSFTSNHDVSVKRRFLFILMLGIGWVFYCGTHLAFHIISLTFADL